MLTRPIPISGSLPSVTGNALRRLRVNEPGNASEWANDSTEVINVEEARSDIRSTTRAGYSTFDSQPGLNALLAVAGQNAQIYLPANGIFNLNGKMITTGARGQAIISSGKGAELANGGIEIANEHCFVGNLRITGAGTYGINITHQGWNLGAGYTWDQRATQFQLDTVQIWDKTYSLYVAKPAMYCKVFRFESRCAAGGTAVYLDLTAIDGADLGDWFFTECKLLGGSVGYNIVKAGGVHITGSKVQSASTYGVIIQPAVAAVSNIQGIYLTGSSFEDCTVAAVAITAPTGVGANLYPRWIKIAGGTVHKLLLDKCSGVTVSGMLSDISAVVNSGASKVEFYGHPDNNITITGTGTDYVIYGHDGTNPIIKTGKRLKITDQDGSAFMGSYLTSIVSTPAYIGQKALVGTTWYYAVGTASPADWVSGGGGGGVDGGLFTDTYTITGIDGGAF